MEKPGMKTIRDDCISFNVPFAWALKKKKESVSSRMAEIRKQINERKKIDSGTLLESQMKDDTIQQLEKEFHSYKTYLGYLANPETDTKAITDNEIEIARNYPVHEFLPEDYRRKGNINCLFPGHEDKHASMTVNRLFLFCHTCKEKMDSLDLTMMYRKVDFKSAVKLLARS